uniref:Uncharacterized protein n=1 Tax=Rhodnius prolixus TaxID=13249 RepID=T1HH70_RHOPR
MKSNKEKAVPQWAEYQENVTENGSDNCEVTGGNFRPDRATMSARSSADAALQTAPVGLGGALMDTSAYNTVLESDTSEVSMRPPSVRRKRVYKKTSAQTISPKNKIKKGTQENTDSDSTSSITPAGVPSSSAKTNNNNNNNNSNTQKPPPIMINNIQNYVDFCHHLTSLIGK